MQVKVRFTLNGTNRGEAAAFYKKWSARVHGVVFEEARDATGRILNRRCLRAETTRHACERPLRKPLITRHGQVHMCAVSGAEKFLNCGAVAERGVMGALTHAGVRDIFEKKPAAWRGKPCDKCDLWRFETYSENVTCATVKNIQ